MQPSGSNSGFLLNVPYSEKDEAKELGARWDPEARKWFVPRGMDTRPFSRWYPGEFNLESPQSTRPAASSAETSNTEDSR